MAVTGDSAHESQDCDCDCVDLSCRGNETRIGTYLLGSGECACAGWLAGSEVGARGDEEEGDEDVTDCGSGSREGCEKRE